VEKSSFCKYCLVLQSLRKGFSTSGIGKSIPKSARRSKRNHLYVQDTDLGEGKVKNLLDEIVSYRISKKNLATKYYGLLIRELESGQPLMNMDL
jgi:putative ABC transport system ATP-binding protein